MPGWASLSPLKLEAAVVAHLAQYRFNAVRVLERPRFRPSNSIELAFSPLGILLVYARTLSWQQTLSWILWIWGLTFLNVFLKARTSSRGLPLSPPAKVVSLTQ